MKNYLKICFLAVALLPISLRAWVAEDIQALVKGNESLLEYSRAKLFSVGDGYIMFAHGIASYKGDFEASRKIAQADAYEQIAKILGESEISTKTLVNNEIKGDVEIKNILDLSQVDSSILMRTTLTRGYWLEDELFHIISCIYLNVEPDYAKGDLNEEFYDINLNSSWQNVLEQNRDIWLGGVNVAYNPQDKKYYLLVLVSVKGTLPEVNANLVLNTTATREGARYLNGISFTKQVRRIKGLNSLRKGDVEELEVFNKLESFSTEKLTALAKALPKIGELKHKASKRRYAVYARDINEF